MIPVTVAVVAALLFAQAIVRLRRRGRADLAGWHRVALFVVGLGVTVYALLGWLAAFVWAFSSDVELM